MKRVHDEFVNRYGVVKGNLIFIYKAVRRVFSKGYIWYLQRFTRIDEKSIVFESIPDYSDNARALSEYLEAKGDCRNYRICWIVMDVDKCRKAHPSDRVVFLPRFSSTLHEFPLKSIKAYMSAQYVMATHEFSILKKYSRKGQKYIRLWHGCGYKDNEHRMTDGDKLFDLALVPGNIFVKTKSYFWNAPEDAFLAAGLPRYYWLMDKNNAAYALPAKRMLERFGDGNKKIIMWMPTFRNSKSGDKPESIIKQFPLLNTREEWARADCFCQENNIVILLKLHPFQKKYDIPFENMNNIREVTNDDFDDAGIPMYVFLAHTDGLITDYSSVAIDYLLLDRPIAFALDDYEQYKSSRGFVFDNPLKLMPGHHLYTIHDMQVFIEDVSKGNDPYKADRDAVMPQVHNRCDNYCENIWNAIRKADRVQF